MKSEIDPKITIAAIVVVLAVVGFAFWRFAFAKSKPTDSNGIPLVPAEAQAGSDAMSKLWKSGVMPSKTR
jgi:hypothetical protein